MIRRLVGCPAPYSFLPAPSIEGQRIHFRHLGRSLVVEAGYDTPLYETVSEVVDFDCYQLRSIADGLKGGAVIDVGANVGVTTLCLALIPEVHVRAFEPLPENCEQLRRNLLVNGVRNVTVEPIAVAAHTGRGQFWVPQGESVGGRLWDCPEAPGRLLEVATCDLTSAVSGIEGEIALMKVDCEGGEYDLVAQLDEKLAARIRRLTFEVHDRSRARNIDTLAGQLRRFGYQLQFRSDPWGRTGLHHLLAVQNS